MPCNHTESNIKNLKKYNFIRAIPAKAGIYNNMKHLLKISLFLLLFSQVYSIMAQPSPKFVYKILTLSEWHHVQRYSFNPDYTSGLDKQSGYIHLSTPAQVATIFNKRYKDISAGVIIKLDYQQMAPNIKWEPNSQGELFPHYYGTISQNFIVEVIKINDSTLPKL